MVAAGAMASSHGNPSATPAPRSKVLREIGNLFNAFLRDAWWGWGRELSYRRPVVGGLNVSSRESRSVLDFYFRERNRAGLASRPDCVQKFFPRCGDLRFHIGLLEMLGWRKRQIQERLVLLKIQRRNPVLKIQRRRLSQRATYSRDRHQSVLVGPHIVELTIL